MSTRTEQDAAMEQATTGHEWDGIREYDTPLPKWWLYTFYACIVIAIVMIVLYPSIPGISGYYGGVLDRQERRVLDQSLARAAERQAGMHAAIDQATPADIAADPDLLAFANAGGNAAFAENCAACHGLGGGGQQGGYPVLADDDWLWGGTLDAIYQTIQVGIRHEGVETRQSAMPAFGALGILDRGQVGDIADHVRRLSGQDHDAEAAARGAPLFAENCAACHGAAGEGLDLLGAPRLNDQIWLYGGARADIAAQMWNPRQGVMPAWRDRLDESTIKMLTVYVHSLGGGL